MRYLGGKERYAADIAKSILRASPLRGIYLEPFLGGGAVLTRMAPHFSQCFAGDASQDVMSLWTAIQAGWVPPAQVSEEDYHKAKHLPTSPIKSFIGFGCSFGGKWFGGYARGEGRNYAEESARSIAKTGKAIQSASLWCGDFAAWPVNAGTVIYCDPPYKGTTGYQSVRGFDHDRFWEVAMRWVLVCGAQVFVSEYQAPPEWRVVAELGKKGRGLQLSESSEKVFTLC